MQKHRSFASAFTLMAAIAVAWAEVQVADADEHPAGGWERRGGEKDMVTAAAAAGGNDGDPYPWKGEGGGGLDYGLINQDGGGDSGAIRQLGKFDGQQDINSELGNVAFGPGPHGNVGEDTAAGSEADAQAHGLPGEGRGGAGEGIGGGGVTDLLPSWLGIRSSGAEEEGEVVGGEEMAKLNGKKDIKTKGAISATEAHTHLRWNQQRVEEDSHEGMSLGAKTLDAKVQDKEGGKEEGLKDEVFVMDNPAIDARSNNHVPAKESAKLRSMLAPDEDSVDSEGVTKKNQKYKKAKTLARTDYLYSVEGNTVPNSAKTNGDSIRKNTAWMDNDMALVPFHQGKQYTSSSNHHIFDRQLQTIWSSRGDIYGEAAGDHSGSSVSLSSDGSVMAVGAPWNDENAVNSGSVRVYVWNGISYVQRGSDIDGKPVGEQFGVSLSLSSDGSVLAVYNGGGVRVYKWDGAAYVQRGSDIDGGGTDAQSSGVSLSSDGSVVAVGRIYQLSNRGQVRVYKWNETSHVQRGSVIDGEAEQDMFGWSVSLSFDGSVLAVGATGNDDYDSESGSVRVYVWAGTSYVQRGIDIDGEARNDRSGTSVSLSSDGSLLAVGAQFNTGWQGHVRVYEWIGTSHVQRGIDIEGEAAGDRSANSISLSSDGSVLAVGAWNNDGSGIDSGSVRVYKWDGTDYVQWGSDIDGEAAGDRFGQSVSLSSDGSVLAVGAYLNDGNGTDSGSVGVYYDAVTTAPWSIAFRNMTADFSADSDKELVMIYQVGRGRDFKHILYAGGCENLTIITGLAAGIDYNVTNGTTEGQGGMDTLQLDYSFNKAKIASSNIWDSSSDNNKIELCQVVELIEQSTDLGEMIIVSDKRNVTIAFDLSASFDFGFDLEEAALTSANTSTSVQDYVTAYHCNESFEEDDSPLVANDQLFVCINSSSSDVEIDGIDSMTIKQGTDANLVELPVIVNSTVQYSAITKETAVSTVLHVVLTRVPTNIFSFADDQGIDIVGSVTMRLIGSVGSGRMLQEDITATDGTEVAILFDVKVALEPEATPEGAMMNSAKRIAGQGFAIIIMTVGTTYALGI